MSVFDYLKPLDHVTPRFTEEQLSEIVEWFDENSKPLLVINQSDEPTAVITVDQLKNFLGLKKFHRRSYHYPNYDEIMREVEILKMATFRILTKDQLIYILDKWVVETDVKHEMKLAFKVFDTEVRDFLEVDTLRDILTTYGDPFTTEEILEFLRDANVRGDGNVFYDDFVESLFALAPELYEMKKEYLYENPDEDPSVPPEPEAEPAHEHQHAHLHHHKHPHEAPPPLESPASQPPQTAK